jgi:hypothetical protein
MDMAALAGNLRPAARNRATLAAIVAIAGLLALAAWGTSQAHASGCENSWAAAKSGSWFTAENWSKKAVPTSGEEVCITISGTYTVTMNQTVEGLTVKALQVGGASGVQTLSIGSTCAAHASLTATNGLTVNATGAVTMTSGDHCNDNVTLVGAVTNAGTITTSYAEGATTGERKFQGSFTNTGTLAVNAKSFYEGESTSFSNKGTITVAEGFALTVLRKASVSNGAGGKISAAGNGTVAIEPGTSFLEGAGTTSGTLPVIVHGASLSYEPSGGESTIAMRGEAGVLSGTSSPKQSLLVQSTCAEHARATAAGGFTNGGTLTMTDGDSCNDNVTLVGAITNTGTITTSYAETATTGQRSFEGNLTNKGTITVDASSFYDGASASLANNGTISVAAGFALTASNKTSVSNGSGGKIAVTGNGAVVMETGTSFTEGAGTTSGTVPVYVHDAALTYEPSGGESTIAIRGESSSLSGNIAAKQTLVLQSTCAEHVTVSVASGFTNAGVISMTDGDHCNDNASIIVASGSITNSGKIITSYAEGATTGQRNLEGNLLNTGIIEAGVATSFDGSKGLLTNEGPIDIAEGVQFAVSNASSLTNAAGGTIAAGATGELAVAGGTFTEGAGTTTGKLPVVITNTALVYEGSGESTIGTRGEATTITGSLAAKQSLLVQSTCLSHARLTAAASFTNAGSITLTNFDHCNNNASLVVDEGATLINSGTLTASLTEPATTGARALFGNVTNTGTLAIDANAEIANTAFPATITNQGTIKIANATSLSVAANHTFDAEGGAIEATGTGVLSQASGTFNQGAGKALGTEPVVLNNTALHYTGTGAASIAVRGEGTTLSGTIGAGQALVIQSTCGSHARVSGSSFTSSGTVELTNADNCPNNVTLRLAGGTLTNKGTLDVQEPVGGTRALEGSLVNENTVALAAGATLKLTGSFTELGKHAIFKTTVAGASSFGSLTATGTATITRELLLVQVKPFIPTKGETFGILSSSGLSGTFTKVKGTKIKKAPVKKYVPMYSGTSVVLEAQ